MQCHFEMHREFTELGSCVAVIQERTCHMEVGLSLCHLWERDCCVPTAQSATISTLQLRSFIMAKVFNRSAIMWKALQNNMWKCFEVCGSGDLFIYCSNVLFSSKCYGQAQSMK